MGYTLPEKTAILEFEEYPGLEVTVRISPVPVVAYFDICRRFDQLPEDGFAFEDLARDFASLALVSWTLDEPATTTGLLKQPLELAFGIVRQWIRAVAEVPIPLPKRSSDGEQSEDPTSPES
jgi:hypothetical protein